MDTTQQQTQSPQAQDDSTRELEEQILLGRMRDIRRKLLVLSGKGGVGKSTVAANLAISLARAGKQVGLLDIDVHGPSIPKLLGLEGRKVEITPREILPINVDDNLSVMSIGLLLDKFNGGPVGLDTIAASISEEADTIMDVYEPYLLQLGFLERTPRGRLATELAYQDLGVPYNKEKPPQPTLW